MKESTGKKAETVFCSDIFTVPHRFGLAFEAKVGEVEAAQARLNILTQRLTFAKRRVETTQGAHVLWVGWVIVVAQIDLFMADSSTSFAIFFMFLCHRVDHEEGGSTEGAAGQ